LFPAAFFSSITALMTSWFIGRAGRCSIRAIQPKVLARAEQPVFVPERQWEKVGQVPHVVFVEGLVRKAKRWLFYYGGADKYVGVVSAPEL
jgi:beta-1,4-mannooligosaccharide phosphorylase